MNRAKIKKYLFLFTLVISEQGICFCQTVHTPEWNADVVEFKSAFVNNSSAEAPRAVKDANTATILIINRNGIPEKIVVDIPNEFYLTSTGFKYQEFMFSDTTITCSYSISEGKKFGILTFIFSKNDTIGIPMGISFIVTDNMYSKKVGIANYSFSEITAITPGLINQPVWNSDVIEFKTAKVMIRNSKKAVTYHGYKDGYVKISAFFGFPYSFSTNITGQISFTDIPIDIISFKHNSAGSILLYSGKLGDKSVAIGFEFDDSINLSGNDPLLKRRPEKILVAVSSSATPSKFSSIYEIFNFKE